MALIDTHLDLQNQKKMTGSKNKVNVFLKCSKRCANNISQCNLHLIRDTKSFEEMKENYQVLPKRLSNLFLDLINQCHKNFIN